MNKQALNNVQGVILMVVITVAIAFGVYYAVSEGYLQGEEESIYELSMVVEDIDVSENGTVHADIVFTYLDSSRKGNQTNDVDLFAVLYVPKDQKSRMVTNWTEENFALHELYLGKGDTYISFDNIITVQNRLYKCVLELWERKDAGESFITQTEEFFIVP